MSNKLFDEPMKQYTLRIPQSVLDRMQRIVKEHKMRYPTISHLIRVVLDSGLDDIEKK